MTRTGGEYRSSLQDGREIYISGERVKDVTKHQEQDPDMQLHVVRETDEGIMVRGARFETAAAVKASQGV